MEVDELCLGRFCRKVVAEEPLVAVPVLFTKEGVYFQPGRGPGKDDPVISVHAQGGFWGCVDTSEERGGVQGGKDRGEWGALRGADWLVTKGAHLAIEGQVDVTIGEERQGPATHAGGKAEVQEDGYKAILMHVVEEALDIKHEGSAVKAAAVRDMDIMEKGEACI